MKSLYAACRLIESKTLISEYLNQSVPELCVNIIWLYV